MKVEIKRSLAEVRSLIDFVGNAYDLIFVDGFLLHSRENDVYRVSDCRREYILKIYPVSKMSDKKLEFIDRQLLNFYGVSYIVRNKSGKLKISIRYPEGFRNAVLFYYFEGIDDENNSSDFRALGKEVARLHSIGNKNIKIETIPYLEFENSIVDACLTNKSKYKLLDALYFIKEFPKDKLGNLEIGLCHGDCHIENAIRTSMGVFLIDFDFMRFDYLASDLASIIWANHYGMGVDSQDLENFFSGYSGEKSIKKMCRDVLLYFIVKREITYILSYVARQDVIGKLFVNDELITNRLTKINSVHMMLEGKSILRLIVD